jgi:hypothetical protein
LDNHDFPKKSSPDGKICNCFRYSEKFPMLLLPLVHHLWSLSVRAPDGEKMGKGVTLSREELLALKELLNKIEL